jgi:hypothetical protein
MTIVEKIKNRLKELRWAAPVIKTDVTSLAIVLEYLRTHYYVHVATELCCLGSDEWEYGWIIWYLPKENWNDKRRASSLQKIESYSESPGGTYIDAWKTPDIAILYGIEYALTKLVKE